jgi:hypothetical protein
MNPSDRSLTVAALLLSRAPLLSRDHRERFPLSRAHQQPVPVTSR